MNGIIKHYQLAIFESKMDKLKEKTGHKTSGGALTKAVDAYLEEEPCAADTARERRR